MLEIRWGSTSPQCLCSHDNVPAEAWPQTAACTCNARTRSDTGTKPVQMGITGTPPPDFATSRVLHAAKFPQGRFPFTPGPVFYTAMYPRLAHHLKSSVVPRDTRIEVRKHTALASWECCFGYRAARFHDLLAPTSWKKTSIAATGHQGQIRMGVSSCLFERNFNPMSRRNRISRALYFLFGGGGTNRSDKG